MRDVNSHIVGSWSSTEANQRPLYGRAIFPFANKREKCGSIENFFSVKVLKSRGYLGRGSSLLIARY